MSAKRQSEWMTEIVIPETGSLPIGVDDVQPFMDDPNIYLHILYETKMLKVKTRPHSDIGDPESAAACHRPRSSSR